MKKFFLLLLVALAVSGCAVRMTNGTRVIFWQRGIVLTIDHQCTDRALVYYGATVVADMSGGVPTELALEPRVFGDDSINLTVKSVNGAGAVVGSVSYSFYIDRQSTKSWTWIISDKSRSSGGRNIVTSRCE